MSNLIHGLPYNSLEIQSYLYTLKKSKSKKIAKIDINDSDKKLSNKIDQIEINAVMTKLKSWNRTKLLLLLDELATQFNLSSKRSLKHVKDEYRKMNKTTLLKLAAEGKLYAQVNDFLDQLNSDFQRSELLQMAIDLQLIKHRDRIKYSKNNLIQIIAKRHMEAYIIVNYFS